MQKIFQNITHTCLAMLFVSIGIFADLGGVSAQEPEFDTQSEVVRTCQQLDVEILGPDTAKMEQSSEYGVQIEGVESTEDVMVSYLVVDSKGTSLAEGNSDSLVVTFDDAGSYAVSARVQIGECQYDGALSVDVYEHVSLYIGKGRDELELGSTVLGTGSDLHLIEQIQIEPSLGSQQITNQLLEERSLLRIADTILLDTPTPGSAIEALGQVFSSQQISPLGRSIYLIADVDQSVYRRLLARYISAMGLQDLYVVSPQYFGAVYTALLLDQELSQFDFVQKYSTSADRGNKWIFLSYIVDDLLANEFPVSIIILMLVLPVVALVVSILRQMIGMSVFGVFTPLLFAVSMSIFGWQPSVVFLLAAVIAVIVTHIFSRYVYLLYSPRISLMMILYTISIFVVLWVHELLGWTRISTDILGDSFVIFPYIAMLMVAKGVFSDTLLQFKKGRRIGLIEFVLVSVGVFYLIRRDDLQNLMLGTPEIVLLILVVNILVGRFTGLQLKEYVRFAPLIRRYMEEEE